MNFYALVIGIVSAVLVISIFRKMNLERKIWVYSALLATFPVYYCVFAIFASDYSSLVKEIVIGLVFLFIAIANSKRITLISSLILAFGYIGHAVYDAFHNLLFLNQGAPSWWPEFCGSIDMLIGLYLLYFAFLTHRTQIKTA